MNTPKATPEESFFDTLLEGTAEELKVVYSLDCCIEATRILCSVLRDCGIEAAPLSMRVLVFNPQLTEWLKTHTLRELTLESRDAAGQWLVQIGHTGEKTRGKWDGHLVCVVAEHAFLDATLTQADRPYKGIVLQPAAFRCSPEFYHGERIAKYLMNGCGLVYQPFPDDRSYQKARAWHARKPELEAIVERLIWRVRQAVKRGQFQALHMSFRAQMA